MLYYPDSLMVLFTLDGPPVGKERARTFYDPRVRKVVSKTPAKTVKYEKALKLACDLQLAIGLKKPWPYDARYAVSVLPYFDDKRRRDLDNVVKIVCDAMNGTLWNDDTQVDEIYTRRSYDEQNPRVEIRVWVKP